MTRNKTAWYGLGTAIILLFAATIAIGQGIGTGGLPTSQGPGVINDSDLIFSRVRLVEFDGSVARLDTATGEVSRFSGQLTGTAARGSWLRLARPLTDQTSGFLELQQVGGAAFLVDVVTGDTWLLRRRGSIASWVQVQ